MTRGPDQPAATLADSWTANAGLWTEAVRSGGIASRRLATDDAAVRAVAARRPRRVLDLGCGEGWLARALGARGIEVVGTDASAPLIEAARRAGGAVFHAASYEDLVADPMRAGSGYDVIVANFALLHEDMDPLLASLRRVLAPNGALVVQTLHPASAGAPYRDGWRTEDFASFGSGGGAWQPMPWYFRTLGSWLALLRRTGYGLTELDEPMHPETQLPLSLLLTAEPA